MSFGGSASQGSTPKSFVSEAELEEKRKKRQEEWDKVRTAEDPVEAPEEEYDPRSLFERLEEQRLKKQTDYEEAHKLKNMIRGLDDDEVTFLEYVDVQKQKMEAQRLKEDMQELEEYRMAVARLSEQAGEAKRLEMKAATSGQGRKSQLALLSAAVKRKSDSSSSDPSKKASLCGESSVNGTSGPGLACSDAAQQTVVHAPTALRCLGVLPGLGVYTDSSDSENSSYSDDADLDLDLIGRRRVRIQHDADRSPKPN